MKVTSAVFVKSAVHPYQYPDESLPEIAFAGRSNVGKSSIINTLAQKKGLAKMSNSPGCTQLINFFIINDEMLLVDLPGYGYAKVPASVKKQWGPMVEIYLKERSTLKLVILVLDIRRDPTENDLSLIKWFDYYQIPFLIVITKIDKLSRQQVLNRKKNILSYIERRNITSICFSSKTAEGKYELWQEIEKLI